MGGNSTGCPVHYLPDDPVPFLEEDGDFNIKLHYVGWMVAGFFGLIGSGASFWLIKKHLEFYTKPNQQKYIVRILFMVPCYAAYSWFSYYWWKEALYFQLLRDCYEAVVIASFFSLLLYYLGDNEEEHAIVFKNVQFKKWIWPFGRWRYKPSGPRFLSIMQWSIGQYWICRPGCTLAAVITEALDLYCLSSWSPRFSHVWTSAVICISVTVAMYAVLQFYVTMKVELAPYQPMLKFFAVKAVVFLTFWGECMLVVLASVGVIKGNQYWSAHEIQVGISAVLSCFVMMIFGFLHVKSFTYLPYRGESLDPKERKFNKTKIVPALGNVLDFRDVARDVWTGTKQICRLCTGKKVEKSFIIEADHLGNALGRTRVAKAYEEEGPIDATKALMKEKTDVEEELERVKIRIGRHADQAFLDEGSPVTGRESSALPSPWQNTTTAFTPLFNFTRTTSPAPSSALGIAPTASLRSSPGQAITFGDARRFPKSSTGILYPAPPPDQQGTQENIRYPEKLEGDAGEVVYGKSTSWFRRVFRRSHSGADGRAEHAPLSQGPASLNDAVIDQILEDRSLSYDYPAGARHAHDAQRPAPSSNSPANASRGYLTTRTGRADSGLKSPPRDGLRMPNPLSQSRYPGFDEQAYVDRMYALHATAMDAVPSFPPWPPPSRTPELEGRPDVNVHRLVDGQGRPIKRVSAPLVQPPQHNSRAVEGLGGSALRLSKHDLPSTSFSPILPPNLSSPSSRRPLPTPPVTQNAAPAQPVSASNAASRQPVHMAPYASPTTTTQSSRHGPVQRLGLGLSLDSQHRTTSPQTSSERRTTHFVYDEY